MSDADLLKQLDNLSLQEPDPQSLRELREDADRLMLSPIARRELKKPVWHPQIQTILEKIGYGEIYAIRKKMPGLDPAPWASIQTLLDNPVQRVAVEVALLARVQPVELSSLLSVTAGTQLTEGVLKLFQSIFFDAKSLSKSEWREYLKLCSSHPYLYVRYVTALTRPRDEALHMVGVTTKLQLGEMLTQIVATANYKFQRYVANESPESDKHARAWAKLAIDAGIQADKYASGDITDFASAVQAEFEMVDDPIPHVSGEMLAQVKAPPLESTPAPALHDQPYVENPDT